MPLIVTPVILLWVSDHAIAWSRAQWLEIGVTLTLLCLVALIVFHSGQAMTGPNYPLGFLILSILIWVAVRLGPRETATAILLCVGIAIWGTLQRSGPFVLGDPNETLLLLQSFTAVIAVTALALAVGVSERRHIEHPLEQSQQRFNYLTDNLNQGVWFARTQPPQILYVNPAFERIWGLPAERFYENATLWRDCIHPDDQRLVTDAYDTAIANPTGHDLQRQYRIVRPDGQLGWIHTRMVIHRTSTGAVDSLSGITEDVTDARDLEDQLRQGQKMEAVGRLAGGVAHDFNNVMTVILGYSAVLFQELGPNSSARHFVQEIQRAGERCAALTGQLLAFSRKQMLHPVSLDLHRVIRDLMPLLKSLIGEHITIVLRLDATPRWVKVDAVQIEQVLLNLALNARDAMPHGGTLTFGTRQVSSEEVWGMGKTTGKAHTYLRLRVYDTGTGIELAAKPKIFEPFFTTKAMGQGTGLGLSTVYGIIHQSGGTIAAESGVGQGTTMTVFLPEITPLSPATPSACPEVTTPPGMEVILLVEDETSVRLLTRHILHTHGYTVHEAEDGFQALELIRRNPLHIDLVVTDMVMPGMNGKELAIQLRSQFGAVKVLFVSGYSDSTPVTDGEFQDRTAFLQKPFTPEDVIRKVQEIFHAGRPA